MTDIVNAVRQQVLEISEKYQREVQDYDFWREHVKLVVDNALDLAEKFGADREIVEISAMLHDIALMCRTADDDYVEVKKNHHETGAQIADEMLKKLGYPADKIARVKSCVLHHRSSKNSENIEETCVADADILAHFDNLPMLFEVAFAVRKMSLEEGRQFVKDGLARDFDDLSQQTKTAVRDRYGNLMRVVFGGEK